MVNGQAQVTKFNPKFLVTKPFDNGYGRVCFAIVGSPFSTILMSQDDYNDQIRFQAKKWTEILQPANKESPEKFIVGSNALSHSALTVRLNLDRVMTPLVSAVVVAASVLGICAAVRRR